MHLAGTHSSAAHSCRLPVTQHPHRDRPRRRRRNACERICLKCTALCSIAITALNSAKMIVVQKVSHESLQWFRRGRLEGPAPCGRLGSIHRWRVAAMAGADYLDLRECRSDCYARRFCGSCRVADRASRGSVVHHEAEAALSGSHARQCCFERSTGSAVRVGAMESP